MVSANYVMFQLAPQVDKPTTFTFSAYMRSDKVGAKARFSRGFTEFGNVGWIDLTTEWKRYYVSAEIQPDVAMKSKYFQITVRAPDDTAECTVWIDALQIEKGDYPSEYEP